MKRRLPQSVRAAVSLLLLSSNFGCSFIFVRTPPSDGRIASRVRPDDCTSSRLAPGFDTAFGALQVVRTGMAASASDNVYQNPNAPLSREADIALGLGFTALFVSSAIYGFVNTSRCSRLQHGDDHDQRSPADAAETWSASPQRRGPSRHSRPGGATGSDQSALTSTRPEQAAEPESPSDAELSPSQSRATE